VCERPRPLYITLRRGISLSFAPRSPSLASLEPSFLLLLAWLLFSSSLHLPISPPSNLRSSIYQLPFHLRSLLPSFHQPSQPPSVPSRRFLSPQSSLCVPPLGTLLASSSLNMVSPQPSPPPLAPSCHFPFLRSPFNDPSFWSTNRFLSVARLSSLPLLLSSYTRTSSPSTSALSRRSLPPSGSPYASPLLALPSIRSRSPTDLPRLLSSSPLRFSFTLAGRFRADAARRYVHNPRGILALADFPPPLCGSPPWLLMVLPPPPRNAAPWHQLPRGIVRSSDARRVCGGDGGEGPMAVLLGGWGVMGRRRCVGFGGRSNRLKGRA